MIIINMEVCKLEATNEILREFLAAGEIIVEPV